MGTENHNSKQSDRNSDHHIASKTTTQHAPLEKFLTYLRVRRILKYVKGCGVLDFGCGAFLSALRAMNGLVNCRYGLDSVFKQNQNMICVDGIFVTGSFTALKAGLVANQHKIDCITSLACFEHLEPQELSGILHELRHISEESAIIVGTVPTPAARPVLEFLSYKLGLIDPSQIIDHKVYYNKKSMVEAIRDSGWTLSQYKLFQFGMNSLFVLKKI